MRWYVVMFLVGARALQMPSSCGPSEYYDPASFSCQSCPANASTVKSPEGFSCTCDEHSIPSGPGHCRTCSPTELVSSDGTACVPRKCQNVAGRVACRKCPVEYISVTQNFDGSPMKEVQCIKCARGFKPQGNICVRCEACTCTKAQVVVRGLCVPKVFVNGRPTYAEKILHPIELLDVVKHEYLCTKNDSLMCRRLANACVKNFYSSDGGGPCRLWLQPKLAPKGLPPLLLNDTAVGEKSLSRGEGNIILAVLAFTSNGGMMVLNNPDDKQETCQLPLALRIGHDFSLDCNLNVSKLSLSELNETLSPYYLTDGEYKPIPVTLVKPSGFSVHKGSWPSRFFTRYFLVSNSPSTTSNATLTVYLRTMLVQLGLQRDRKANGSLRLQVSIEAQYASVHHQDSVTTTLKVVNVMPSAGVVRGLEVLGGALGSVLALYALVQYRGALRRGSPHYCLAPLLSGAAADTLYFAALLAALHSLAGEAGTLGLTLPLSHGEETIIRDFLFSAVCLKVLKIVWIIWKQCNYDIFFINWAEYNPPVVKDITTTMNEQWKSTTLAKEWNLMQTKRRANPGFTVAGMLFLHHFMIPWSANLPQSRAYSWVTSSIAWWCSYTLVLTTSSLVERFVTSSSTRLPRVCTGVGMSLMVFEEELYAHYVHGRNDDFQETRSMVGPLATCRVACVPKLRAVCRQLSTTTPDLGENDSRQILLSKFLAAFFERALDGLNWVASERTVFERALNIELSSREAGGTSALLYDDDHTPSCFAVTWWSEEWNLSTFDAMMFSCAFIASGDTLLAALVTITNWQVMKLIRTWFGNKNLLVKTGVDVQYH